MQMLLRSPLPIQPHLYIGDSKGRPLDAGKIFIGEPFKDPELYPINVFYDEKMTITAMQPIRTKGGFVYANGDMSEIYAQEYTYSIKVVDANNVEVFYKAQMGRDNQEVINNGLKSNIELISISSPTNGVRVFVKSFYSDGSYGGGYFQWDENKSKSLANGGTIIDPDAAILNPPTKGGIVDYLAAQGGGIGAGCWVLQQKERISFEQFGLIGMDSSDAFVIKHTSESLRNEVVSLYTESTKGVLIEDITVPLYRSVDFAGDVSVKHTGSSLGLLSVNDFAPTDTEYLSVNLTGMANLKDGQVTLPFLTKADIGKFVKISSSEQIVRIQTSLDYYLKTAVVKVVANLQGNPVIYPAIPFDMDATKFTSVKVYKLRDKINLNFKNLKALNSTVSLGAVNGLLQINRNSVDVSIEGMSIQDKTKSLVSGVRLLGSGVTVNCKNIDTYSSAANDNYAILLNSCNNIRLNGLEGGDIASRFGSDVVVTDSKMSRIDDHFGNKWTVQNSKVDNIRYAGKDLDIINTEVFEDILIRGDTPLATGTLRVSGCKWKPRTSHRFILCLSSIGTPTLTFPYITKAFDNIVVDNLDVSLENFTGSQAVFYLIAFPNELNNNRFLYPESINVSNINVRNVPTSTVQLALCNYVHIGKQPVTSPYIATISASNLTSTKPTLDFAMSIANAAPANSPDAVGDVSQKIRFTIDNVSALKLGLDGRHVATSSTVNRASSLKMTSDYGSRDTGAYRTTVPITVFNSTLVTQVMRSNSVLLELINVKFAGAVSVDANYVANGNAIVLQKSCYATLGASGYKTPLDNYLDATYYITTP